MYVMMLTNFAINSVIVPLLQLIMLIADASPLYKSEEQSVKYFGVIAFQRF